jgi:type III secretion protein V
MRAGHIEMDEAKRRRNKLEKESQLYGAMDGAMKFVKGDAVAGLIIIAVNMIGGIAIGTMQNGMSVSDAMQRYSLLTIGDGLVSQIPALLISITAGLIVTRVASDDNRDLGSDISRQLVHEPKALMITSAILGLFAIVPGFPTIVFLSLSALCGGGGYMIARKRRTSSTQLRSREMPALAPALGGSAPSFPNMDDDAGGPTDPVTFALTVPLIVDIASAVRSSIRPEKLDREVARVRRALYFDLGVPFPGINLRLNDNLKEGEYRILVNEIPVASGAARPGYFIVRETEANLQMFDIPFERGDDFLPNTPSLWVQMKYLPQVERAGIQIMTLSTMLTYHLAHVLKSHASEFIGIQEAMYLINQMQKGFGELVREVTRILPIITITDVFQRLVSEDISIRDLRTVLEALVEWGQREKDPIVLAEHVRSSLGRYITHKFSGGQNIIPAYLISKEIEDVVRGAVRQTSGASYLALSPDSHRQLITSMKEVIGSISHHALPPVVLAPMDIRRFMRKIIERDFPDLAVLSYQELTPSANVQPLERIKMSPQLNAA